MVPQNLQNHGMPTAHAIKLPHGGPPSQLVKVKVISTFQTGQNSKLRAPILCFHGPWALVAGEYRRNSMFIVRRLFRFELPRKTPNLRNSFLRTKCMFVFVLILRIVFKYGGSSSAMTGAHHPIQAIPAKKISTASCTKAVCLPIRVYKSLAHDMRENSKQRWISAWILSPCFKLRYIK